jgi:hypothetical protein
MAQVQVAEVNVLVQPGEMLEAAAIAAGVALGPYTLRGSTANFDVYYDNSLAANGQALADAVLASCEQDLAQLQTWFGGIAAGRFPVYIDPGSFGAYHANCAATEMHCAAFSGTNGALVSMLVVAEADEVFMANQAAGWNCGASHGEGLSRVLATERYPAQLDGFASGASWLDSNRPDWVTNTEGTDRNYVSIGCATLFLNYQRYQLNIAWDKIVQAGGATLADNYRSLTDAIDAFGPFAALLQRQFPTGTPSGLVNDNPFPLLFEELHLSGVTDDGGVWHAIRHADGTWTPFGDVKGQSGNPGHFAAAAMAGVSGELQITGVTDDGGMWHAIRHPDGSWTPFGDVKGQSGNPGHFDAVGCAEVSGELQVCGLTDDGGVWHAIRHADGSWTPFGDVKGQSGNLGHAAAIACAGIGGELQACVITDDGGMWHTIRHPDGTWQPQFGDVKGQSGNPGHFTAVGAGSVLGELQVCGLTDDGGIWHTIRRSDGTWQPQFGDVTGQSGRPGFLSAVACAGVNDELQVAGQTDDGGIWHTIRHPDRSWQGQFGDVKGQSGNPGHFDAVACASVG